MPKPDYDNDYNYCMLFCEFYKNISKAVNGGTDNAVSKKDKTTNDFQNTTQKTKDRATQIPLKTGEELRSTSDTHCVTVKRFEHHI
jgi:hypothetical protein